ncbi:MAG: LPS export ABC transporter periplasmic protein LptC [Gelidibacter sp.]|nr:LPS export ABC transporter periplasmic protein LptC [Gelidibacter sp.]
MKVKDSYKLLNIVIAFAVTMFFSCKNNYDEVQQIGVLQNEPIGVADTINLKYTDSGKIKADLVSTKMLDYSNRDFEFTEFPQGIKLTLFADNNKKSVITSDYAISYSETDLIDLRGNVVIVTQELDTLFAEQLYFDQKKEWIFTNRPIRFVSPEKIMSANAYDSNKDINVYGLSEITGIVYLD